MQAALTAQLQDSLRAGTVGALWEGDFPRYVWGRIDGQVYEARLVNKVLGEYKGFPLEDDEWPLGVFQDDA